MSNFKEVMNRVEDNRLDSMFYKSSDHTRLRRVSFREREWVIEPFGEVRPVGQKYWKFVDLGLYDDVYGDPYELDEGLLLSYLEAESSWEES